MSSYPKLNWRVLNPTEHDVEVLFGVAGGAGAAWHSRWDRARAASEYVYAEPLPPASA